jgi:hypothetical protein
MQEQKLNNLIICNEFVGVKNLIRQLDKTYICSWCLHNEAIKEMQSEGTAVFRSWFEQDFLILDTETKGLYGAEIVEIGIIDRNDQIDFESLIN